MMRTTVIKLGLPLLLLAVFAPLAAAAVAVGDSPELKARAVDGREVDIAQWRGRLVLVDFWIGRVDANKEDERKLVQLHQDYHAKGLEIVGVCCERRISD